MKSILYKDLDLNKTESSEKYKKETGGKLFLTFPKKKAEK
jgi:hypothetical protein